MKRILIILMAVMVLLPAGTSTARPITIIEMLLSRFVDDAGHVDYAGLKADPSELAFVTEWIATQDAKEFASWSKNDRLGFWINAYNVLTLKLIVDHYPIESSGMNEHPANSIQQIPNAWTRIRFDVMGKQRTLDEIENRIIRREFAEPRIHMALVCSAVSCPPLRREPYGGDRLDAQLDDQARRFLADPGNFRIDRARNEVWVSRILQWFAADFVPGAPKDASGADIERRAVLAFATRYVSPEAKKYLETAKYEIKFLDYDWTLNEQKK